MSTITLGGFVSAIAGCTISNSAKSKIVGARIAVQVKNLMKPETPWNLPLGFSSGLKAWPRPESFRGCVAASTPLCYARNDGQKIHLNFDREIGGHSYRHAPSAPIAMFLFEHAGDFIAAELATVTFEIPFPELVPVTFDQ